MNRRTLIASLGKAAAIVPAVTLVGSSPEGQWIEGQELAFERDESGLSYAIAHPDGTEEWIETPAKFPSAAAARQWWDDVVRMSPSAEHELPVPRPVLDWIGQ